MLATERSTSAAVPLLAVSFLTIRAGNQKRRNKASAVVDQVRRAQYLAGPQELVVVLVERRSRWHRVAAAVRVQAQGFSPTLCPGAGRLAEAVGVGSTSRELAEHVADP